MTPLLVYTCKGWGKEFVSSKNPKSKLKKDRPRCSNQNCRRRI